MTHTRTSVYHIGRSGDVQFGVAREQAGASTASALKAVRFGNSGTQCREGPQESDIVANVLGHDTPQHVAFELERGQFHQIAEFLGRHTR